jgi:hypothetical protein
MVNVACTAVIAVASGTVSRRSEDSDIDSEAVEDEGSDYGRGQRLDYLAQSQLIGTPQVMDTAVDVARRGGGGGGGCSIAAAGVV